MQTPTTKYNTNWVIAENLSDTGVAIEIAVPQLIKQRKDKVLMKIFAEYETQTGINYFHIFEPKEKEKKVKIKLLPNRYFLEYQDEKMNLLLKDTLLVQ